jgi:hypothetical protein
MKYPRRQPMFALGHSLQGRICSNFGDDRYCAESGNSSRRQNPDNREGAGRYLVTSPGWRTKRYNHPHYGKGNRSAGSSKLDQ